MMGGVIKPLNMELLVLTPAMTRQMHQVTNLNIFKASTNEFDANGLFSTEIFGKVGSEERNKREAYIDLRVDILHPMVFSHLTSLKKLYLDIASGVAYAKFDNKLKDFVPASQEDGETGYKFLYDNYTKLKLEDNGSDARKNKIEVIQRFIKAGERFNKLVVLPAGLRDYTVDEAGKPSEDEVNGMYRSVMATVNVISGIKSDSNSKVFDNTRYKIQKIVLDIHMYFLGLLDGKSKFVNDKWTKRAVVYGTRNVITPLLATNHDLDNTDIPGHNSIIVGTYQYIKAISPLAKSRLKNLILDKIFNPDSVVTNLVDMKTKKTVSVELDYTVRDEWTSLEGLEGIINKLGQAALLQEPVKVDKYYLLLIADMGDVIHIVYNTEHLPEGVTPKDLRPITYLELFYITVAEIHDKYPAMLTRYPVANVGGIYPGFPYLKTTDIGRKVTIKNGQFSGEFEGLEYPILGESNFLALSPNIRMLKALGADFDGDKCNFTILLTDDSKEEITKFLASKEAYVSPSGGMLFGMTDDQNDILVTTLTIGF
jgi:hypothetical protein